MRCNGLQKRNNKLCFHKSLSRTFYFSVEQYLEIIFPPKCLLNVWLESIHSQSFCCHLLSTKNLFQSCSKSVINLTFQGCTGRISALSLFCTDQVQQGPYCQDLGPIFSQYGPCSWLIRCIYHQ